MSAPHGWLWLASLQSADLSQPLGLICREINNFLLSAPKLFRAIPRVPPFYHGLQGPVQRTRRNSTHYRLFRHLRLHTCVTKGPESCREDSQRLFLSLEVEWSTYQRHVRQPPAISQAQGHRVVLRNCDRSK